MNDGAIPMSPFRRNGKRHDGKQEQALSNPIRRRIVELFTTDEARSLTAKALTDDLGAFANVSVGQVGYHLACLRDASLVPAGKAKGQ
jgi:DNA-binding transcriptional ArsR family regulator